MFILCGFLQFGECFVRCKKTKRNVVAKLLQLSRNLSIIRKAIYIPDARNRACEPRKQIYIVFVSLGGSLIAKGLVIEGIRKLASRQCGIVFDADLYLRN